MQTIYKPGSKWVCFLDFAALKLTDNLSCQFKFAKFVLTHGAKWKWYKLYLTPDLGTSLQTFFHFSLTGDQLVSSVASFWG